jgi:hypothetical protein
MNMQTVLENLLSRHCDPVKYRVSYDDETACFLLYNFLGQIVGYQQYRYTANKEQRNDPEIGRYYTYFTKNDHFKHISIWGLENLDPNQKYLFLTEGIFDAIRLQNLRLNACATLSNDPMHLTNQLFILGQKYTLVAICDNDESGQKLAKFCHHNFTTDSAKDLGDLSNDELNNFVKKMFDKLEK